MAYREYENLFLCNNCGGFFPRKEMMFESEHKHLDEDYCFGCAPFSELAMAAEWDYFNYELLAEVLHAKKNGYIKPKKKLTVCQTLIKKIKSYGQKI